MGSIEIDAVHSLNRSEIRDLRAGLRIHNKHSRRRTGSAKQSVCSFVKGSVTIPLAAHRPRGHYLSLVCIHDLNFVCGGNEDEQSLTGLVQKLRRMRLRSDVANVLVRFGVDDPNFAIVLACVFATVSHVDQFRVRIVSHSVGPKIQLDGIKQFESVSAEDAEHSVVTAGHKHLLRDST